MAKNMLSLNHKSILITGAAGFIGANLAMRLLKSTDSSTIIGIDSLNQYYDVRLKHNRLESIASVEASGSSNFQFHKLDIADSGSVQSIFDKYQPNFVINLAAQAGVRYSITNPDSYIHSNIIGFYNILECCRKSETLEHLVYASSSSVYGGNKKIPFSEADNVDNPVSLYAATKKSNELLAYSYSKLYNIPSTGLRFFTVYGPAGRPDMAYFSFADKLSKNETIKVFNYGNCQRDFTFIDDIIEGITRVICGAPQKEPGEDGLPLAPYSIYNIGNSNPENLMDFIRILAEELIRADVLDKNFDIERHMELVPMQAGDVPVTFADTGKLAADFGFKPQTDLRTGLRAFAQWYKKYSLNMQEHS